MIFFSKSDKKPEFEIEKFSIIENIADEGTSGGFDIPIDENDPIYEVVAQAFGNILGIYSE